MFTVFEKFFGSDFTVKVRITNMMFYGYHGYYEYEREQGQKFYLDAELKMDENITDLNEFEEGINTARVYEIIKEWMETKRFQVMSSLGIKIADSLLERVKNVDEVIIRIRKPALPISGCIDYIETEVIRHKN